MSRACGNQLTSSLWLIIALSIGNRTFFSKKLKTFKLDRIPHYLEITYLRIYIFDNLNSTCSCCGYQHSAYFLQRLPFQSRVFLFDFCYFIQVFECNFTRGFFYWKMNNMTSVVCSCYESLVCKQQNFFLIIFPDNCTC